MFIVFEQYQKSRTTFVQTVAELASRPQNIETLQNAGKVKSCIFSGKNQEVLVTLIPTFEL